MNFQLLDGYNLKNKKHRKSKKLFTGSLYWIPEETHLLEAEELEALMPGNGKFFKKGNQSFSNIIPKEPHMRIFLY